MVQNFTRSDVELLKHETVFQGYFRVDKYHLKHRLFAGGWSGEFTREVFERGHAASCLPYDPVKDRVLLIEQFRVGPLAAGDTYPWMLEAVAGVIDHGESPESVASREAKEEAGIDITGLVKVADAYASPGGTSERVTHFIGRFDSEGVGGVFGLDDENEDIRAVTYSFDEAMNLLSRGRITNAALLITLMWLALHRDELRTSWA